MTSVYCLRSRYGYENEGFLGTIFFKQKTLYNGRKLFLVYK